MAVKIRLAELDDLPAIMLIEDACFSDERFNVSVVRSFLARKDSFALVAVDENEVIGAAMCICSLHSSRGRIASVAVVGSHRGRGIGSKLIAACEDEFRRRGACKFTLEVAVDNAGAVKTYLDSGYHIKLTIRDYYSRGRSAYYMEKETHMEGRRRKVRVS